MINRKELKVLSKEQLKRQWSTVVLITFIFGIIGLIVNRLINSLEPSILLSICSFLITAALSVFETNLYLKLTREVKVKFNDMFVSGSTFLKCVGVKLLQILILIPVMIISIFVATFLLIGIAASIGLSQDFIIPSSIEDFVIYFNFAYYFKFIVIFLLGFLIIFIPIMILGFYMYPAIILMCEDDTRGVGECIGTSFRLMNGHLWEYIVLQLSYLGWLILGILTLCIGYLWLIPYINTVNMNFFNKIVGYNSQQENPEQFLY